ncbi:MAG: tetratricopeptide repeat protein [Mariprofundaceae bacterium]
MRYALLFLAMSALAACQSTGVSPAQQEKQAESRYQLGLNALQMRNLPRAFEELMRAQKLAPDRPDILDALGVAWRLHGNLKRAEEYYLKAIKMDPPSEVFINYGSLLMQLDRPVEAETYFHQALDDPRYRNPDLGYISLGDALLGQDKFDEAMAAYRQAAMINPREPLARLRQASAYARHGRAQYAQAVYESLLREQPGNREAMQGMLKLLPVAAEPQAIIDRLKSFRDTTSKPLDRVWADEQLLRVDQ